MISHFGRSALFMENTSTMSQEKLIDPNKLDQSTPDSIDPKKVVKKKNDIVERNDKKTFTEDGKEILI